MPRGYPKNTDAKNNPVHAPAKEVQTDDSAIPQRANIAFPEDGSLPDHDTIIVATTDTLKAEHAAQLAFNESPVDIRIEPGSGDYPEAWQHCAVNGKGCEIFIDGAWREYGHFPVGQRLTTKIKYAEVLLFQRGESVKTDVQRYEGRDPVNELIRRSTHKSQVTVFLTTPQITNWFERSQASHA